VDGEAADFHFQEKVAQVYQCHPAFTDPKEETLLWRYMDFTKFYLLLRTGTLYFPAGDVLARFDPFEGSFPEAERQRFIDAGLYMGMSPHEIHQLFRRTHFISCWHYNKTESIAMWKLYASSGYGIAIQTTVPDLKTAFRCGREYVYMGAVRYIDYTKDGFFQDEDGEFPHGNEMVPFIHKRSMFSHEREYRAIVKFRERGDLAEGLHIKADLRNLVRRVVLAPKTANWVADAVRLVIAEYLPGVEICPSVDDLTPLV